MKRTISERTKSFTKSSTPLTSKRASVILSSPIDSSKLANAVRATRHPLKKNSFKLTKPTAIAIRAAQKAINSK